MDFWQTSISQQSPQDAPVTRRLSKAARNGRISVTPFVTVAGGGIPHLLATRELEERGRQTAADQAMSAQLRTAIARFLPLGLHRLCPRKKAATATAELVREQREPATSPQVRTACGTPGEGSASRVG
jgi:hypothetical protein